MESPPHRNQAGFATRAVHVGQEPDPLTGAVLPPVYHATTFVQDEIGRSKGFDYSLSGNPTRNNLDLCLADLEGAETVKQPASGVFNCVTNAFRYVCRQIVHDDDVARRQGWNENLLDIGLECYPVHRTVQDHGCAHSG